MTTPTGGRNTPAASRREKRNPAALVTGIITGPYQEVSHRLAADTVRRHANQHGCDQSVAGQPCAHPDHRRDVLFSRYLLDMLAIPRDTPTPRDTDRTEFVSHLRDSQSYTAVSDIRPAGSLY